ncbi:MAG: prolipoprotein diacylglyceryl transferase [Myxococcales bacterium]|nr:prolipoprotein diacylglyceryl transferase [Myxococcales bacterium]
MLPYIHVKDLAIGPLTLHPFGILVALGVVLGTWLATWRARVRGMDLVKLNSFVTWMLVAGFIGGHVLDSIFYHPKQVLKDPLSLIRLWEGLSSFGGFTGGAIGIAMWKFLEVAPKGDKRRGFLGLRRRAVPETTVPFMDVILSVFPVAWIFGRSGCTVVHDHMGAKSAPGAFLSVAYPGPGDRPQWDNAIDFFQGNTHRYDLGLMELSFTIVLAALLALTWKRRLPTGTYIVAVCLSYAPVRFAMDRLRITEGEAADPRYLGMTPGQWACIGLFAIGLVTLYWTRSLHKRGIDLTDRVLAPPETPVGAAPA